MIKLTLDEAIKHCEEVAEKQEITAKSNIIEIDKIKADGILRLYDADEYESCMKCASEHRQLAEWLKELKTYREFADWLVKAVLEEDWEESADFYAEVLCRKLTKLGKLKVENNKYMEVNADG